MSNRVSGGQCRQIYLTIPKAKFSQYVKELVWNLLAVCEQKYSQAPVIQRRQAILYRPIHVGIYNILSFYYAFFVLYHTSHCSAWLGVETQKYWARFSARADACRRGW